MSARILEMGAAKYELAIDIDAPPEVVWQTLTEDTDGWWLADFRMVGEGSVVSFDTRAGGQLIERREDGASLLWYTVQMCAPGVSLHLVGHIAPEWGGPATTMLHLALEAKGGGTVLRIQDAIFGCIAESTAKSLEAGWRQLFSDGLKRRVESA